MSTESFDRDKLKQIGYRERRKCDRIAYMINACTRVLLIVFVSLFLSFSRLCVSVDQRSYETRQFLSVPRERLE